MNFSLLDCTRLASFFLLFSGCGPMQPQATGPRPSLLPAELDSVGGNQMTANRIAELGLVALVVDPMRTDRKGVCSGTLVQAKRVLTAAHCFANPLGAPSVVQFGVDAFGDAVTSVKIKSWSRPASADLALVELESEAPKNWKVAKVLTDFPGGFASQNGFGAGYGRSSTQGVETAGIARELDVQFQNVTSGIPIAVALSGKQKGFCYGDSGGPLFVTLNNQLVVIGVLSNGAQNCETGIDNFTLTPFYGKWLNR